MAFNINNYCLKYYKEFTNLRGELVRLEIHEKTASLSSDYPMEIGELCGLALEVEGRSETIDIPIVKTTLTFSMIDTSDMGDEEMAGTTPWIRKHGNWQEFYTPDATKYLVVVKTKDRPSGTSSSLYTRWMGYITPDSWEESLSYRGTITITARDNIGSLSELPFDMSPDSNGMIKVRNLINRAFSKASVPMSLYLAPDSDSYDYSLRDADGNLPLDLVVSADALEDMTWYEALECVLDSLGLAIRFTDPNGFILVYLRYLPHLDYGEEFGELEELRTTIQFHGGTKILDPAYKQITEKIDFGFDPDMEISATDIEKVFRSDERPYYTVQHIYYVDGNNYYTRSFAAQVHASMDYGDDGAWDTAGYPCFLDVSRYQIYPESLEIEGDDMKKYLFAAANSIDSNPRCPTFKKRMVTPNCKISFEFAPNPATVYNESAVNDWVGTSGKLAVMSGYRAHKISYFIRYQTAHSLSASNVVRYWNGSGWQASAPSQNLSFEWDEFKEAASSFEVYLSDCPDVGTNGYLVFSLRGIDFRMYYPYSAALLDRSRGIFCRIKSVKFESLIKQNIGTHTTTTNNQLNTACNVRLSREPKFGFLPQSVGMLFHDSYKYAFFLYDDGALVQAPYQWKWEASGNLGAFPAITAKQILCYHADSEAILEGDFSPVDEYEPSRFHRIFRYKGRDHILQGGTLDFRVGRFVSATIRGFKLYNDLFND